MKIKAVLIGAVFALCACNGGNDSGSGQENSKDPKFGPAPNYAIKDIWEFYDANGSCSAGEQFGDGGFGCLHALQLTRFQDGSAYFSADFSTPLSSQVVVSFTYFLAPGTVSFAKHLDRGSGMITTIGGVTGDSTWADYEVSGCLTGTVPQLSVDFSTAFVASDSPKSLTLQQVF